MKVSIITYYNITNYGSALQMYALSNHLEQMGHEVCIFDFLNMNVPEFRLLRVKTIISRAIGIIKAPKYIRYRKYSAQDNISDDTVMKFQTFYKNNFSYYSMLYKRINEIDMYVAGSDQVWNIQMPNLHYVFFMRFINIKKRMSYAASFGGDIVPKYNRKVLKKYLSQIKHISVRERSGVKVVKNVCNKEAIFVLDPVLLVGKNFWEKRLEDNDKIEGYVFCYFLDYSNMVTDVLQHIKDFYSGNMKFICADTGVSVEFCEKKSFGPLEFVSAIKNASIVITDSFHATAFSLLFNKKFYVIQRNYKIRPEQSTRIESLLHDTNTIGRFIKERKQIKVIDPSLEYDYEYVNNYFEAEREKSNLYIMNVFSNGEKYDNS